MASLLVSNESEREVRVIGIFDIFSAKPAQEAERLKQAALREGLSQYGDYSGRAREAITGGVTSALAPWQTYQGGAQRGMDAFLDASGANGPEGLARAQANFEAMGQPGIEKAVDVVGRGGVARGVATGNIIDEQTRTAENEWARLRGNYTSGLSPFLGGSAAGAGALSGLYTGQGSALANIYGNQGQAALGTQQQIGQSQYASAMAPYNASANLWGFGLEGLKTAASLFGGKPSSGSPFASSQPVSSPNAYQPTPWG